MECSEVQRGRLFHERHPRKSQTTLHRESLRRSVGGPIVQDKLSFFFDSEWVRHRTANCHGHYHSNTGVQNYVCSSYPWEVPIPSQARSISRPRSLCRFIRKCFRFTEILTERRSRTWLPVSMPTSCAPPLQTMETVAPIARACRISSDDHEQVQTVRNRLQTSMKRTPPGFASRLTPAFRLPIPIPSTPLFDALFSSTAVFLRGRI